MARNGKAVDGELGGKLLRLLSGEASPEEARDLRQRLSEDEQARETFEELRVRWESLELPPPSPVPPGFRGSVEARLPSSREGGGPDWHRAPRWARAAAAAAAVVGIVAGAGATSLTLSGGSWGSPWDGVPEEFSVAERYLQALSSDSPEEGTLGGPPS